MADATTFPANFSGLRQFQRFGECGPKYEVLAVDEAQRTARVHVFENGEEFDYSLDHALADPPADAEPQSDMLAGLKTFQRFGPNGPAYEILGVGADPMHIRIRILNSEAVLDYRLSDARADPAA